MASATNEGLYRFSGLYGLAYRLDPVLGYIPLGEVIEVSGAVEVNRIDVPLVGKTRMGHKPGRETREGTLRVQKIDSKWEIEVWEFLSKRKSRSTQVPMKPFSMELEYDDPDALGEEKIRLEGCLIWRLPVGFSIGDDLVEREFPFTWEDETYLKAFRVNIDGEGNPSASPLATTG
jgi:hypothetical protein